jgi:hypothetical protein
MKDVEAYVDDVVIKTIEEDQLIADLTEAFANVREFQWKLNTTKCVFGVPSGLLLVSWLGIEASKPTLRRSTLRNMAKPPHKKYVMKLEAPIRKTRGWGGEWESIKILHEGDGNSKKMNTACNTRLRLTTQVGQAHVATRVPLDLGTNTQPSDPRTQ